MENTFFDSIINEYESKKTYYDSFCNILEHIITQILQSEGKYFYTLTKRVKSIESLKEKIVKKGEKYKTLSDITDIAGLRIITYYSDHVDSIANIIEQEFEIDKVNTIDKRATIDPDKFGYISTHYIVSLNADRSKLREYESFKDLKAEIQIRTILQHAWADIEHDLGYKSKNSIPRGIQRDFNRLSGLLELADKEFLSIRNSLSEYKEYVSENMNKPDKEILIDKVSLSEFIKSNQLLQQLNQQIADIWGSEFLEYYLNEQNMNYVQLLGLKTLRELNCTILENKDLALYIAKENLKNKKLTSLSTTVGLFYIFYATLSKMEDKNEIYNILKKSLIGFDDENRRLDFANRLSEQYKSFLQSQSKV